MLTYIMRRILYSIPVLIISTFLIFTFVSLAGEPTANIRQNPQFSVITYNNLQHKYHLDRAIPVRYWFWVEDAATHKLGTSLVTSQPIWPDIRRTAGHSLQVIFIAEILALILGGSGGVFSLLLCDTPVLRVRLLLHGVQFLRLRNADVLAGIAAADPVRRHLLKIQRPDLLHGGLEQPGLRDVVARSPAAHRAAGDHVDDHLVRAVLAIHARVDARRDQHGLCPYRAREGAAGEQGDHSSCLPERAHSD